MTNVRLPTLALSSRTTATTFTFRDKAPLGGWACCTVNDTTGELNIQSDWGSWAYRWSPDPKNLGAPTLTAFIADRNHVDYLARKLNNEGRSEERFSARKTAKAIQHLILERRREDARRYGAAFMSRTMARDLWRDLDELALEFGNSHGEDAAALFFERLPTEIHHYFEDLWQERQRETKPACVVLRESILPALVAACREEVERRARAGQTRSVLVVCPQCKRAMTCISGPDGVFHSVICAHEMCGADLLEAVRRRLETLEAVS